MSCVDFSSSKRQSTNPEIQSETSPELYFESQQKPLITLDYITIQLVGDKIDIKSLKSFRITGSSLRNSIEYGGNYLREKQSLKLLKDPKDNYYKINWQTNTGENFHVNLTAVGGVIRL